MTKSYKIEVGMKKINKVSNASEARNMSKIL